MGWRNRGRQDFGLDAELGIPELLTTLETIAELHELKADPTRSATGTCLEASLSEGRGVLASVLVREGTLRVGEVIVCGDGYGRVRAIFDDKGRSIEEAGPSTPVEVSGLDVVPTAGENFAVVEDIPRAREVAHGPTHPRPRRSPTPIARRSRWKTSTPRWPSRSSRA